MLWDSGVNVTNSVYQKLIRESENARREMFKEFHYFYIKDKEEIERIIKRNLVTAGIFTSTSVDKVPFQYSDIIQKGLKRLSAGVFDKDPIVTIDDNSDDDLSNALVKTNFFSKCKEALKKSLFVNTVVSQVVKRDTIEIDNLMPDTITVLTDQDYLKPKGIAVTRFDPVKNEIYVVVWSKEEHYIIDSFGNEKAVEGNAAMINPFDVLPFSVLRQTDGIDFYGEPNWDLFLGQVSIIVQLMQADYAAMFNSFPIWIAENLNLADGEVIHPGKIIKMDNVGTELAPPNLRAVSSDFDFSSQRDSIDWRISTTLSNLGLPAASSSLDVVGQSGVAKQIDEVELNEIRADLRNKCYYFCLDLLEKLRVVWNYYAVEMNEPKIPEGKFDIQFQDIPESISMSDLKIKREMEIENDMSNPVNFIMEDYEVDEETATEMHEENIKINKTKTKDTGVSKDNINA